MTRTRTRPALALLTLLALAACGTAILMTTAAAQQPNPTPLPADALDGGVDWINTRGAIHLPDLKGKIVLLDFWTYCCINCHHVLPDLAKLEAKYPNELVVIGVHTAKFEAEKRTANIRQKVNEYGIKHPVINDAEQVIWSRFGVNSWPTLVLIDPMGRYVGNVAGEGHYETLDRVIGKLVADHRKLRTLDQTPLKFEPEDEKAHGSPLRFPGKVAADAASKRLFISDTAHNRIVIAGFDGAVHAVAGTGEPALRDGPFAEAGFHRPQGLRLIGDTLYVADTENHAIRALDLAAKTVATVAGTGESSYALRRGGTGPALKSGLNSPWDVLQDPTNPDVLVLAMAGPHQLWKLDLKAGIVGAWAGSGIENIVDGTRKTAAFAQPSGLATDGDHVFVADSEVSGLRAVSLKKDRVDTIVGVGLFGFGDIDGKGPEVRLQHCLGVAYGDGVLYVADSYNNKIKVCDPKTRAVTSLVGGGPKQGGLSDDPARFDEPGGLALAGRALFIADTNNHAIRVYDLDAKTLSTLEIKGLAAPSPPARKPTFPGARAVAVPEAKVAPGDSIRMDVTLTLPEGWKINPDAPMPYLVEASEAGALADSEATRGGRVGPPSDRFSIDVPLAKPATPGQALTLKLMTSAFLCQEARCEVHSLAFEVPVRFEESGPASVTLSAPARAKKR
jgi:thiol-disulfide isomerase/thioredoxin